MSMAIEPPRANYGSAPAGPPAEHLADVKGPKGHAGGLKGADEGNEVKASEPIESGENEADRARAVLEARDQERRAAGEEATEEDADLDENEEQE